MADLDAAFTLLRSGKVVASGPQTEFVRNIEIRLYVATYVGVLDGWVTQGTNATGADNCVYSEIATAHIRTVKFKVSEHNDSLALKHK